MNPEAPCPGCRHALNWHTANYGCTHADTGADEMWATCPCTVTGAPAA